MSASMDVGSARKRRKDFGGLEQNDTGSHVSESKNDKKKHLLNSFQAWTLIFIFYFALFGIVQHRFYTFPEPKFHHPGSPNDTFYESNARVHLKKLTAHGPRVVGSISNEVIAYGYIVEEVKKLQSKTVSPLHVVIDEQLTSGAFDIEFLSDFVSVYKNMKNIVVKLKGSEKGSPHSVLMSCHFDSAVDSPGAGDNAISCALMVEVLRAISQSKFTLKHNIIFLFNGAEENLLQASHGFITQHPWAKSIKAFVNVDSAGAGGWDMVFQTGPSHPWLVRMYAESIPFPSGSILGQEIFQSGFVPADTDFRIYRDFGEIPGLDIAYISNGYVYHTPNDQERFIEPGCVQRSGENIMALLLKLANSDHLANPGEESEGTVIFFDIVGYVMIKYSESVAIVINSTLVAAILFKIIRKTFQIDKSEQQDVKYFKNLTTAVLYITMSWIVIFVTCFGMAMAVTLFGRNMSWYTHTLNIVPIFLLPSFVAVFALHEFFKQSPLKLYWLNARRAYVMNQSGIYSEQMFFDANMLIWSLLTIYLTLTGIGSAFIPMLCVSGPLVVRESFSAVFKTITWKTSPNTFFCIHLLSIFIPSMVLVYIGNVLLMFFVPILGRTGPDVNSDIAVGILIAALVIVIAGFLIGICYICDDMKKLISVLVGVICLWLALIVFTPLGFPYKGDYEQPTPMRLLAFHVERNFHDIKGMTTKNDSGIWLLGFDYTNNHHLVEAVPRLRNAVHIGCDYEGPYCSSPYLIPVISLIHPRGSLYLYTEKHGRPGVSLRLVSTQVDGMGLMKMSFEVGGEADHMTLQIRPKEGVDLEVWSFSPLRPEPASMPPDISEVSYYVYYSHGTKPDDPLTFSLHLKVPEDYQTLSGIVDIGISGHYLHGDHQLSNELQAFLDEVPDWTTFVGWTITYSSYKF